MTTLHLGVRWFFSVTWLFLSMGVALSFVLVNFLVSWQAFDIIGFEDFLLADVPLLGPVTVAMGIGTAPLAAAFAFGLTAVMGFLVATFVKRAWELISLAVTSRRVDASRNAELAAQYKNEILLLSVRLAILGLFTGLAVWMDIHLFELRLRVLLTDTPDIADFVGLLPDVVTYLGEYLAAFASAFVWGYTTCVFGAAVIVEEAFARSAVRWQGFATALEELVARPTPETRPAVAEPIAVGAPIAELPHATNGAGAPTQQTPAATPHELVAPPVAAPVSTPASTARPGSWDVDVIVGPGQMRRVALAEVEGHPEQFVRDSSGRHWFDRQYYESVMGRLDPVKEERQR